MHQLRINVGSIGPVNRPDPDAPAITIDGHPINTAYSISIEASADGLTKVLLGFHASVEGDLDAYVVQHFLRVPPPAGVAPTPEFRAILAGIEDLKHKMTDLTQAEADEAAAVSGMIAELSTLGGELTTAVSELKALQAAGGDTTSAITALEGSAAKLNAAIKAAQAADPNTPAPPAITVTPTAISGVAGATVSGQFEAAGSTGNLTWSFLDAPPDITFNADGSYSGTPAAAEAGDIKASYVSDDGSTGGPFDVTYSITAAPTS